MLSNDLPRERRSFVRTTMGGQRYVARARRATRSFVHSLLEGGVLVRLPNFPPKLPKVAVYLSQRGEEKAKNSVGRSRSPRLKKTSGPQAVLSRATITSPRDYFDIREIKREPVMADDDYRLHARVIGPPLPRAPARI